LLVSLIIGIAAEAYAGVCVCACACSASCVYTEWVTSEHSTHTGKQDRCWVCTWCKKLLPQPARFLFENEAPRGSF